MGYYEATWARMGTILAHLVVTGRQSAPGHRLTCRSWIQSELGNPLGWSWQATCRAVNALVDEGYLTETEGDPAGYPARRKWLDVSDKGHAYYATLTAEGSREDPASVTAPDDTII